VHISAVCQMIDILRLKKYNKCTLTKLNIEINWSALKDNFYIFKNEYRIKKSFEIYGQRPDLKPTCRFNVSTKHTHFNLVEGFQNSFKHIQNTSIRKRQKKG